VYTGVLLFFVRSWKYTSSFYDQIHIFWISDTNRTIQNSKFFTCHPKRTLNCFSPSAKSIVAYSFHIIILFGYDLITYFNNRNASSATKKLTLTTPNLTHSNLHQFNHILRQLRHCLLHHYTHL